MCNVCCAFKALNDEGIKDERLGIEIRAWGRAEFSPAVYQIKKIGDPWPEYWYSSLDLAGTMSDFGLDVKLTNEEIEKIKNKLNRMLRNLEYYKEKDDELYKYKNNDPNILKADQSSAIPEVPIKELKKINEGQE